MTLKDLERIIWPTSVDMMGQVVVAMTFFFLLMFIVLAYFLKQIELKQRLRTNELTYQELYQPIKKYIAPTEEKRRVRRKHNIDELLIMIQDYILSAPPSRIKDIKSLISKRNELVDKLHYLGYTGYSANNPFTGDYATMPLLSLEILDRKGKWIITSEPKKTLIKFINNSVRPDRNSFPVFESAINKVASKAAGKKLVITVYDSANVITKNLSQRLSLHRVVLARNQLRTFGFDKNNIIIRNHSKSQIHPYGAIELIYE